MPIKTNKQTKTNILTQHRDTNILYILIYQIHINRQTDKYSEIIDRITRVFPCAERHVALHHIVKDYNQM